MLLNSKRGSVWHCWKECLSPERLIVHIRTIAFSALNHHNDHQYKYNGCGTICSILWASLFSVASLYAWCSVLVMALNQKPVDYQFYLRPPTIGKWEAFKLFFYNSSTGEVFGRTGPSWGKRC
jgi:hypothetical protein